MDHINKYNFLHELSHVICHVCKHWSKMLLSYDGTIHLRLRVWMIYHSLLLYFCGTLSGGCLNLSSPQLRDGRNCGYASLQIWTAQWPVCVYLVLRWPVSTQKEYGNPSNADKFFILAETF